MGWCFARTPEARGATENHSRDKWLDRVRALGKPSPIMRMRILPDGSIEFDESQLPAVLAAQAKMRAQGMPEPSPKGASHRDASTAHAASSAAEEEEAPPEEETGPDWDGLIAALNDGPRRMLRVAQQQRTVTMPEMVEALGAESEFSVSGYMTSITRTSAKFGYEKGALVGSARRKDRMLVYSATDLLVNSPEVPESVDENQEEEK